MTEKLTTILKGVSQLNSEASWQRLFMFPSRCLVCPKRGGRRQNLCNLVNEAVHQETDNQTSNSININITKKHSKADYLQTLANRVSSKLEGDLRGAVRIASSSTAIAPENPDTLKKLKDKHPPPHPSSGIPPLRVNGSINDLDITPSVVRKAIFAFPAGSAGGPDVLRPQYLKDIMRNTKDELLNWTECTLCKFLHPSCAAHHVYAVVCRIEFAQCTLSPIKLCIALYPSSLIYV